MEKIVRLERQELIRVRRAADDMNLPCQGSTLCPTEPIKPSQSDIVSALSAIGKPKFLMAKCAEDQFIDF
jgi:hypothetical protein